LNDEPDSGQLVGIGHVAHLLQSINRTIKPFVNLFPYREFKVEVYDDYKAYTELLITDAAPGFVSFDNYALSYAGMGDDFYNNLEIVRTSAMQHRLPFVACIQSVAHFGYLAPTEETLSLQVYTAIAYGARGIEYFTFYTPERGNYRLAAIDPFGRRTSVFDALRTTNTRVAALAPTLTRLTSTGVFHDPDAPKQGRALTQSAWVRAIHMEKDEDGFVPPVVTPRFLIGEFTDPRGRPYVMLVNKDLKYSFKFDIEFRVPIAQTLRVSPYTGAEERLEGEQNWIPPGGAVLMRLAPKDAAAPIP
jgi:hypothetical protein